MSYELSNAEVALLCEIGERDAGAFDEERRRTADGLLAKGYVERAGTRLKLTAKAIAYLGARGAGLNES